MEIVITRMSARRYYGSHATGSIVLCNGWVLYHATKKEVNQFLKEIYAKYTISKTG